MAKDIYSNSRRVRKQAASPTKGKKQYKKKRRKSPLIAICIVLIVISALSIAGMAFWNSSLFANNTDTNGAGLDDSIKNVEEDVINFLVVGIDQDDGRETNQLTDTILVVSFHVKDKNVTVLQIPRDTYIGEEYTSTGKINALYASSHVEEYKGIEGLAQFIYDKLNIPIDHYATITMKGFRQVIDQIGGVEVDVPNPINLDGVELDPGKQVLNGDQAEKFVRQRHGEGYSNGDIDRLEMQRLFMASLVNKLLSTSKTQLVTMLPGLAKEMTTDMTVGDMASIGSEVLKLNSSNITFTMVPGESATVKTSSYGNQSVYSIHAQLLVDLINQNFRYGLAPITVDDLGLEEIANTVSYLDNVGGSANELTGGTDDTTSGTTEGGSDE